MKIAWKYLDKIGATMAALRDYDSMRVIINNTPDEIKDVYEKMTAPHSAQITGMPHHRNPQAGAEKLAAQIDKLDILRERYSTAVEYMAWFEAAWGTLTDTEQRILKEYYMTDDHKSGAAARVECALGYCDRQIRRIKEKALQRLSVLLYGK